MIPDAELVITAHLQADSAVVAITEEIVGKTPESIDEPWAQLTLIEDPSATGRAVDHLIEAVVQVDCYAGKNGSQADASQLSLAVRAALNAMPVAEHGDVVVTSATARRRRMDDTQFKPPMTRYVVTGSVWMHS